MTAVTFGDKPEKSGGWRFARGGFECCHFVKASPGCPCTLTPVAKSCRPPPFCLILKQAGSSSMDTRNMFKSPSAGIQSSPQSRVRHLIIFIQRNPDDSGLICFLASSSPASIVSPDVSGRLPRRKTLSPSKAPAGRDPSERRTSLCVLT
ncbi:hypothetical protein KUCAC02_001237 [Chaenocephalus aceratus]|uniref:Uncharacterized protein n=1 Tax=Chaenocephalus aceratus TaxID=36190 RepID=A0ACB9XWC7_CHAAC|nr:hypothetical protein KUCAC02_001237 [Chaenocephalus aceratus]